MSSAYSIGTSKRSTEWKHNIVNPAPNAYSPEKQPKI